MEGSQLNEIYWIVCRDVERIEEDEEDNNGGCLLA